MRRFPVGSVVVLVGCLAISAAGPAAAAGCDSGDPKPPCERTGPQSPRDLDRTGGANSVRFSPAPPAGEMQLCDIHFHKYAEHRSPAFSEPGGEGKYRGWACKEAPEPSARYAATEERDTGCKNIAPGETVEVHWVFTTCDVDPAPCLSSCFSDTCSNPQLRVEAQVWYLTEGLGADFGDYREGAPWGGAAVEYAGSTTGPDYDNKSTCSQFQVTWSVRTDCRPLNIATLDAWCDDNPFEENEAHGARKLVEDPGLLAPIPPR